MVEWKKIGDCIISLKTGLNPRKNFVLNSEGSTNYYITVRELDYWKIIPSDKTDRVNDEAIRVINNRSNLEAGDVLFSGTGTIGRTALVKETPKNWNIKEGVYTIKPKKELLNSKFLIELFHSYYLINKIKEFTVGDPIRSVPMKNLVQIQIPVPSLSEQQRIVEQLDTFTSSIENLKEQIAQRRKQYEYYRDQLYYPNKGALLKASEDGKVEVKTLDEIGTFTRGRRFVRTDIVPEGVPCIHYGDMYTYYGISADTTPTHLTKEIAAKLRFAKKGDVVIVAAGENDIDIGVGVAWLGNEDVVVHDACFIYKHDMNPKYISHYLRSGNYHQQIRMGVVDGKICSISAKELGRTLIPLPPLSEQQRIVSILDTFEASINNLEQQLAQREKQYEYYRNKLLTFE